MKVWLVVGNVFWSHVLIRVHQYGRTLIMNRKAHLVLLHINPVLVRKQKPIRKQEKAALVEEAAVSIQDILGKRK